MTPFARSAATTLTLCVLLATAASAQQAVQEPGDAGSNAAGTGDAGSGAAGSGAAGSAGAPSTQAQAHPEGPRVSGFLSGELAPVIDGPGWQGDDWSVMVLSLTSGDTLFARDADRELAPASNLKLFTTAAALHYLGPDYRYSTFVAAHGPVQDGVLEGDLVLYGTGDPTISGRFNASQTAAFEALADSLQDLGIRRVAGDIVGDGSWFEGAGIGRGWQDTYITHTYAAPSGALNFNDNVVTFHVKPGASDAAPVVITLLPAGTVPYRNAARTVASGRTRVEVERETYQAPLVLTGQMAVGSSPVWRAVPVPDPAHYTATAFAEVLVERGIQVDGQVRAVHDPQHSAVGSQRVFAPSFEDERPVQVLAVHRSPPLQEILTVINQRSHNLYADVVLRTVGRVATREGSIDGGAAAVLALLEADSPEAANLRMEDGSGLSVLNRASAGALVELLAFMDSSDFREQYLATLPQAGVDRGLRRMQETPAAGNLRAKTGTIENVSALSGYVTAANGERLAFAIISNRVPSTWAAKRIEDRIGGALAAVDRPLPRPDARSPGTGVLAGADAVADNTRTYVIQGGDTLEGIARRHGVTLSELEAANPGVDPRRLMPGQELALPVGG